MPLLTHDIFNLSLGCMGRGEISLSKPNSPERQIHSVRAAGRPGNQVCVGVHGILGAQTKSSAEYGLNKCVLKD